MTPANRKAGFWGMIRAAMLRLRSIVCLACAVTLVALFSGCGDVNVDNGKTCTENSVYACPGVPGTTNK